MMSKLDRRIIISKDGVKNKKNNDSDIDLSVQILESNKKLSEEFNESDENIKEMFLLENGYMYLDLDVNFNNEANLMVLYYSKNMSEETKNIMFDLLNEETRKSKIIELFNDRESKIVLSQTNNIKLYDSDLYNHLSEEDKEKVEEEFFENGEKAGVDLTAKLLPWNKKDLKLVKTLKE